jgi:hypothetical protein
MEATLRALLLTLLQAVNSCEDMSEQCRGRLERTSQVRRLPYSKERLGKRLRRLSFRAKRVWKVVEGALSMAVVRARNALFPGRVVTVEAPQDEAQVYSEEKELSERERLRDLKALSSDLYAAVGSVQLHLKQLRSLRGSMQGRSLGLDDEGDLRVWVSGASDLCLEALRVLKVEDKVDTPTGSLIDLVKTPQEDSSSGTVESDDDKVSLRSYVSANKYTCSPSVLGALLGLESPQGFRSRGRVDEFLLPLGLHDTVSTCIVHGDIFSRSLHALGDDVLEAGTWSALDIDAVANMSNRGTVWTKQLTYRHHTKGTFFGRFHQDLSLLQVLNVSSIDSDQGSVSVLVYVNATQRQGYNYTVMVTLQQQPLASTNDVFVPRQTRVQVEVEVQTARNSSTAASSAQQDVLRYTREFVSAWQASALEAVAEERLLDGSRLDEREQSLLRLIGHDDDEAVNDDGVEALATTATFFQRMRTPVRTPDMVVRQSVADDMNRLKTQLRVNVGLARQVSRAQTAFVEHVEAVGLYAKTSYSVMRLLRMRLLRRLLLWTGLWRVAVETSRRWDLISVGLFLVKSNAAGFFERRISTPVKRFTR